MPGSAGRLQQKHGRHKIKIPPSRKQRDTSEAHSTDFVPSCLFVFRVGQFLSPGDGVEEGVEQVVVLGENLDELHAVADLRIRGDNSSLNVQQILDTQLQVESSADRKRTRGFDVATAEAEV